MKAGNLGYGKIKMLCTSLNYSLCLLDGYLCTTVSHLLLHYSEQVSVFMGVTVKKMFIKNKQNSLINLYYFHFFFLIYVFVIMDWRKYKESELWTQ